MLTWAKKSYIFCIRMTTKRIRKDAILSALITSQARVDLLRLLFLGSGDRHYLREIASLTQQPIRAVQRELARLEAGGLLTATTEGNRRYFQVNRESPVFPELKALLVKTIGLGDVLRHHLQEKRESIQLAFLFGSYAGATESPSSDIDLLIIGDVAGRELARLLAPARETFGREINTVTMTPNEFRAKATGQNPFVLSVLSEPKVFLLGNEDDLTRLADPKTVETPQNIQERDPGSTAPG